MPRPPAPETRLRSLRRLVGNTPMFVVHCTYRGRHRTVYAKAEHLNLTGSIKDRMALHILASAYERGTLTPGDLIVEATSGNTGIAFAALGRALGHPVSIFMPDWMSEERKNIIRFLGADIHLVSRDEGGFLGSIARAEELAREHGRAFLPHQFSNDDNCEAHARTTGPEILAQLASRGLVPTALVAGVGTGGTIMGAGRFLRSQVPGIRLHPLEPANSPTLTTGYKVGRHRIQGISDEFIPAIIHLDQLDDIVAVDDGDAIVMAQQLARELGLAVGISAGANFLGALRAQEELDDDAVVVTFFCDDNKKYLSTDLARTEPLKPGMLAPEVTLLGFEVIERAAEALVAG
jgi:cysteine synthase A